jgi:hypothetical protein
MHTPTFNKSHKKMKMKMKKKKKKKKKAVVVETLVPSKGPA